MSERNNLFIKIILASALATVSTCAVAIPVSFDLQIANPSTAIFRLTNTSTSAEITGFSATIGDTTKNFDLVSNVAAFTDTGSTLAWTLNSPDTIQDNVRSDVVDWTLTGFDPGDRFDFTVDIDDDISGNTNELFNQVFFNNGMSPNSVITVWFTDGGTTGSISMTLPDDSTPNKVRYDFSGTGQIPEPETLLLLAIGIVGIGFKSRAKS